MFKRKSEFIYITKNTSRDDLIEECRRLKNLICQLRFKKRSRRKKLVKLEMYGRRSMLNLAGSYLKKTSWFTERIFTLRT